MKKILASLFALGFLLPNPYMSAQKSIDKKSLQGSWLGKISVNALEIRLVFNIKLNEKDSLTATADSPDQGAKNIPLGRVTLKNDQVKILAPLLIAEYNGTVINDSTINGTFTQRGANYIVNLRKVNAVIALNRPQEPKPPFPYTSEDVTFINDKFNITLAGTLTIPDGKGPFPAVIMITGSGAQNRNEELMGHKPFWVIADYLTRNGIAVLRYDDRGVGKSQGVYSTATTADLGTDAEAAFIYLKNNSLIDPQKIGLAGHSEGGMIAPMIAAQNKEVAFIVSIAGARSVGISTAAGRWSLERNPIPGIILPLLKSTI